MQQVYFGNGRGQRLAGVLAGDNDKVGVICCHGMLATKDGLKHQELAESLARRGLTTLRFDFAGRGESDGDVFDLTYTHEIEDLRAALAFLAGRGIERFAIFGSSMGGSVALLTAAEDERVEAVATVAAVAYPDRLVERYPEDTADWREQGYIEISGHRISSRFIEDARGYSVLREVGKMSIPLLIMHGLDDRVVPVADADDIAAAAHHVSVSLVEGADHRFSEPRQRAYVVEETSDFFAEILLEG